MNPNEAFNKECLKRIRSYPENVQLRESAKKFTRESIISRYTYNFSWLGRPIIQFPQDMVALQEIIWKVQPDAIIETGIAHGGSLIFFTSMLELIGKNGEVLGIDIDIRSHNRNEIAKHPMAKRIKMVEGSSVSEEVIRIVNDFVHNKTSVLVVLDSYHGHDHVLNELELYSPFVSLESYCVVFDTYINEHTDVFNKEYSYHAWNGDNPHTAVREFLQGNTYFEIDRDIHDKLLITSSPGGYLKRVKAAPRELSLFNREK